MKRTPLRKKSKNRIPVLKDKLWKAFSAYIRERDKGICFTCGRKCEGSGYHAGHFISKAVGGLVLYFHEENVNGQCYNCNINLGGNQYIYGQKLGEAKCKELYALKGKILKWEEKDYIEQTQRYIAKLAQLKKKNLSTAEINNL